MIYFGNDSGLWRSTDNVNQNQPPCSPDDANHFQNLNAGLGSLAEVHGLAEDPANSAILLAGLGANGDAAATTSGQTVWPQVLDGYGSYVAIDPSNSQNWYAQSASGVAIDLCSNGSSCAPAGFGTPVIGYAQVGSDAYAFSEPAPFLLDPQSSANLILGTCHVWRGPPTATPGPTPICWATSTPAKARSATATPRSNLWPHPEPSPLRPETPNISMLVWREPASRIPRPTLGISFPRR